MASLRDLRERRKTISSIEKITNAMKVVSVSKFRRTQKQMMSFRPYADKCREIFKNLSNGNTDEGEPDPYLVTREIHKVCYVLVVGDKGLCGGYNNNLLRYFEKILAEEKHECSAVIVGKWGNDVIDRLGVKIIKKYGSSGDTPDNALARRITDFLAEMYLEEEADEVVFVYEKFLNVMTQKPSTLTLLPVGGDVPQSSDEGGHATAAYFFEPEKNSVLHNAVLTYIDSTVYQILLETKAGEHASRMTAMTSATDNTEQLMSELALYMNRVRQADITTEISEIVGGAAALKKRQQQKQKQKTMEDS